MAPTRRRSFTKEQKISCVELYFENGKNINQISRTFNIDRKQIRNWVKQEEKLRKQKPKSRAPCLGKVRHLFTEKKLYTEFKKMRKEGKKVVVQLKGETTCARTLYS